MADQEKATPAPFGVDHKADVEHADTSSEDHIAGSGIAHERAQQLADLPDPDKGKTEEERREIVSSGPF